MNINRLRILRFTYYTKYNKGFKNVVKYDDSN